MSEPLNTNVEVIRPSLLNYKYLPLKAFDIFLPDITSQARNMAELQKQNIKAYTF